MTSNCVNPGYVRTPLVEKQIADQAEAHGHLGTDEVIEQVLLAHSAIKRADRTGGGGRRWSPTCARPRRPSSPATSLAMDGGWTAQLSRDAKAVAVDTGLRIDVALPARCSARDASAVEYERPVLRARAAGADRGADRRTRTGQDARPAACAARCASSGRRETELSALFETAGDLAGLRDLDDVLQRDRAAGPAAARHRRRVPDAARRGGRRHLHAGDRRLGLGRVPARCGWPWARGSAGWSPRRPRRTRRRTTSTTTASGTPSRIDDAVHDEGLVAILGVPLHARRAR